MLDGRPWSPTSYTAPLTERFLSDGPRLAQLVERHYRTAEDGLITLDQWQRELFNHVLERYPLDWPVAELRGRLRYRQVVISLGRQNGKSLIGSAFALYGLLQHCKGPNVLGIATTVDKANIVYGRVKYAIDHAPPLKARLKTSGTRGIKRRDGAGEYQVKPASDEGVQGEPVSLAIADELHIMRPIMWDSIVTGQRSMAEALVLGITTAGDEASVLLKRLYKDGLAAVEEPAGDERFGFFLWEAPEGASLDNPDDIKAANPAVACGRIPVERVQADEAKKPEVDVMRFTFNRFVKSATAWLPSDKWRATATGGVPDAALADGRIVFAFARTPAWEHASVTAQTMRDGILSTEVIASIARARRADLVSLGRHLAERFPNAAFTLEAATLSTVGKELRDAGLEVWMLSQSEMAQASAGAFAAIAGRRVSHAGDALLTDQMPHAKRKHTLNGGWRVVAGSHDADAVLATVAGLHVAEVRPDPETQLF
ncbi:terminase large subunit domain-containing protein [Propionibacteriaceae bacterium G57]|uniref:terminase large subunit domain-containing protein n=1 Tax=Aestuariimicrobium sp. G57 TaxID=3418485 RepID=UPI003DA71FE8